MGEGVYTLKIKMGRCGVREKGFWAKDEGLGSPQLGGGLGAGGGWKEKLKQKYVDGN